MTTSQHPRQAETGSPVRHALGRPLRALRHMNDEQMIFWECFWRSARAPQPRPQVPARVRNGHATAGSGATWATVTGQPDTSKAEHDEEAERVLPDGGRPAAARSS